MTRIAVLSNVKSTNNLHALHAVRETVSARPGVLHRELQGIVGLIDILREWAAKGVDLIAINGGDGTVQAVITLLLNERPFILTPVLALIPGGRTNMDSADLGGGDRPEEGLRRLFADIDAGRVATLRRRAIRMQIDPNVKPVYGMFFGAAGIAHGIETTRNVIYPLNLPLPIAHGIGIAMNIFNALAGGLLFRGKSGEIRVTARDGWSEEGRFFIIMVTTLHNLLGIVPLTIGQDGMHYTSILYGPISIGRAVHALIFGGGRRYEGRGMITRAVDELELSGRGPVTLDGEFFTPLPDVPVRLSLSEELEFVSFR